MTKDNYRIDRDEKHCYSSRMKKGVPISPGIAVARAYRVDQIFARRETSQLDVVSLTEEIHRFERACSLAIEEIESIATKVHEEVGSSEAAIFQAHRLLLQDPTLMVKVQSTIINRHVDAATAIHDILDEYTELFSQIPDESLRGRLSDLRDVLGRVLTHLNKPEETDRENWNEPVVIVAEEILPSQAMMLNRMNVAGIVTESGGPSSHAAILARALGIPAVSGLRGALNDIRTGELLAVDGREGHIYIHPGAEVEAAYRKLQREYVDLRDRMIGNREQEAFSLDGIRLELLANVNNPSVAVLATITGGVGVGLYRTEFLFLAHPSVPDEDEQFQVYKQVIESSPNQSVTIRTLDLGGDKHVPYLGEIRETNPFLGWLSIRLTTAHPEFFQTQLRAILRAARYGEVKLLFPMISTLEEVLRLKRMVKKAQRTLQKRGIPFVKQIPIGVMIEVPASALTIRDFLGQVDFVSVGTNDLIQYVMAADRDNPKVAHLCEPFNPAVLRILNKIVRACLEHEKPITLCGEMAGRPRCFLPLFGMGFRSLSMSPAFVPTIKELALSSDFKTAHKIARRVLRMQKIGQVQTYLGKKIAKICPNVAQLDTTN